MLIIKSFTFNPIQENTYLVYNEHGECIIVDPGCYDLLIPAAMTRPNAKN